MAERTENNENLLRELTRIIKVIFPEGEEKELEK